MIKLISFNIGTDLRVWCNVCCYAIDENDSTKALLPWYPINAAVAMLLLQLISTRGGEHNFSDEKLNKHSSTLQHGLLNAKPNKRNVAKYSL